MRLLKSAKSLLELSNVVWNARYLSNKTACLTKIHRKLYLRLYPTLVVQPDGSTYTIRHYEPRRIIKLPLDISTLSKEEIARVLEARKPKTKIVVEETVEDEYDLKKYLRYRK